MKGISLVVPFLLLGLVLELPVIAIAIGLILIVFSPTPVAPFLVVPLCLGVWYRHLLVWFEPLLRWFMWSRDWLSTVALILYRLGFLAFVALDS